ncbi:MAG TPA: PAS domain S-box protein, partial [Tepidisphaeraceae bacterium]|nr:PAS domain S-box protein [Tepidisphaeraceae bacterium]
MSEGVASEKPAGGKQMGGDLSRWPLGVEAIAELMRDLPVAVYACDGEGRITFFNRAAAELWGRVPAIGVDRWCGALHIYHMDGTPMPLDECLMALAIKEQREVRDVEVVIERPDGTRRNVMPFPSPLYDGAGRLRGAINVIVDVSGRFQDDAAREAADVVQAKLGAIVESSDDAIVSKTLDGIITSWNHAAERMFGYPSDEAIGKSILLIVPPERRGEEATIISRLRRGERIDHFDTQRITKDGRLIEISLTVSPIRDSSGKIVGASKIARDITEKKRIEEQRDRLLESERYAREESQRVNRMKDDFLATLSHELRTPLNAIMGWSQLLAGGQLTEDDIGEAGRIIERNARVQKQLIDDLLDMSRIVSGKLRLEIQRIDGHSFITAAIDTTQPSARAKDITIDTAIDPHAGPIAGDPARLQQVVWNLLSNAVKFTPRGGRVTVSLDHKGSHVELTVSDTGQGIPSDFLPHLFSRFAQADSSSNRKHGGLGLGLAIVKQLVELHGGTVRAESGGADKGTAFALTLPLAKPAADEWQVPQSWGAPRPTAIDSDRPDLSGLKILLVDDEPDARSLVRRLLTECGANVAVAESAAEALALLERGMPDVLVSDIGMPEIDGYEFLRTMRKT